MKILFSPASVSKESLGADFVFGISTERHWMSHGGGARLMTKEESGKRMADDKGWM